MKSSLHPTPGPARFLPLLAALWLGACATPPAPQAPPAQAEAMPVAEAAAAPLRLAAVGDIMLGGSATPEMVRQGYDYPFEATRHLLQQADIVFGNLEGPLTDGGVPVADKTYVFRSPPAKVAPALAAAGFRVLSLANNHALDYGPEGLFHTIAALEQAGIAPVGAGADLEQSRRAVILQTRQGRLAFLAYSLTFPKAFWAGPARPGTAFGHETHVRQDVARAKGEADMVVVSFHWGREATTELRDYQVALGRAAIEAGAGVVLGHHPHVLQAVERYRDGVILYSLGNFAFGSYSRRATRSVIAQLEFRQARLRRLTLIPLDVNNVEVVFQPRPLEGEAAREVIAHLDRLSRARGTPIAYEDGTGVLLFGEEQNGN